ncbi:MAG TPA: beta-propeller fold lactonase family protein [Acidobacteriaceae bacterium]|jgi:6-phosphogluconolactonase (cycloisomerase 2 family)|nr:beta-propeller fold lactonase family protein [Acidobacteriaceae bacterium]
MKFRKLGRIALATAASLFIGFGTQSCYYYTEAYIIVTGSQYNQVASYREQNQTGQLTLAPHTPTSSGGVNPIRSVLLSGGRYVYVLNEGQPKMDAAGNITWSDGNISLFSIGGDGSLSFQLSYPSQGMGSIRLALSATGTYLYVLDQYAPGTSSNVTPATASPTAATPCLDSTNHVYRPVGDITVFSIDPSTGRLFLVQNQQQQNALGTPLSYFPVGCGPIDFHLGSNYLYTAEASDPATGNTQVVYAYNAAISGQLIQVPGGAQPVGTSNMAVIGGSQDGKWIYILDNGTNMIYTFTSGGNGLLSAVADGAQPNIAGASGMTALTTDSSEKYLYVTNNTSTGLGQPGSVISIFNIVPGTGVPEVFANSAIAVNPYPTGSSPQCIFQDPSHQYVYTAGAVSNMITGAKFDPNSGTLTNLGKGSSYATVGTPTWCIYSSNTD